MTQRNHVYKWKGKLLSLNKCFKTIFDNCRRLRDAIKLGTKGIVKYVCWVGKIFNKNHWLEKKKNSKGLEEILNIIFCQSNEYVYI